MAFIDFTTIRFDQPLWLWVSAAAIPIVLIGWFTFSTLSTSRKVVALILRTLLIVAVAIALAEPTRVQRTDDLAVIALIDTSDSARNYADVSALPTRLAPVLASPSPADLTGVITFDGLPRLMRTPRAGTVDWTVPDPSPSSDRTDIAAAINAALSSVPPSAAARILLISDGNQTEGDALAVARAAAARRSTGTADLGPVPIDVLPLAYDIRHEVAVESVDVPPRAVANDTVNVRVTLTSAAPARGNITVRVEGGPSSPARSVEVPPGTSVVTIPITLGERRVHRVVATFEPVAMPDGTASDTIASNNTASTFTLSPGKGSILIVSEGESSLVASLRGSNLQVETITPAALATDPLDLQSADLIVLDDVPADALSTRQQETLVSHVRDFGAGLIVSGGTSSFGAGGWRGSAIEPILPVRLDLPDSVIQPELALVLVLDSSGSMNRFVMGSTRSQMDVATEAAAAAVRTLDKRDQVGVIEFNSRPRTVRPLGPNTTPAQTASEIESISADGGTNLPPALAQAVEMLSTSNAKARHIIVLSDGRSMGSETLVPSSVAAAEKGIQISTISVGDDADFATMEEMAQKGRGKHYAVLNPAVLPRVFLRAIRIMRAPLVRETPFTPRLVSAGSPLVAGFTFDDKLDGVTLTRVRPSPLIDTPLLTDQGEPLLAHWQVGLGRVAAFTSNTSNWSRNWAASGLSQRFWSQMARTLSRSGNASPITLSATSTSSGLQLRLVDSAPESTSLQASVTLYPPQGDPVEVPLSAAAPGEYISTFATSTPGAFIAVARATRDGKPIPASIAGVMRGRSSELATLRSNLALLTSIAQASGGRVLDPQSPQSWNLFDRARIVPRESWTGLWPSIVAALLLLTLLDIASRRIAWDRWGAPLATTLPTTARLDTLKAAVSSIAAGGERALGESDGEALRSRARDARRAARLSSFATAQAAPNADLPPSGVLVAPEPPAADSSAKAPEPAANESPLQAAKRRAQSRYQDEK
ncbi:MAG: VWA domain-containing protein [Planctomycetes bacterium]|nr:VWA domain-containing protein [Planctomycetota bacterium]